MAPMPSHDIFSDSMTRNRICESEPEFANLLSDHPSGTWIRATYKVSLPNTDRLLLEEFPFGQAEAETGRIRLDAY